MTISQKISTPVSLLLLIGLIVGALYCVFIPFGAGFDEDMHMIRIWELSGLHFLPNQNPDGTTFFPGEFEILSYQRRSVRTPAADLFQPANLNRTVDWNNFFAVRGRAIYSPVNYLPQTFIYGLLLRVGNFPVIPATMLARLAGLLAYLVGIALAIRLIPFGKWVLFVFALAPTALFQAATINSDSFTIAISFLFLGYSLKLITDTTTIQGKQVMLLVLTGIGLALSKQGILLSPFYPLLLIGLPVNRFSSKRYVYLLWGGMIAALGLSLGWNYITFKNFAPAGDNQGTLTQTFGVIFQNPLSFFQLVFRSVSTNFLQYIKDMIGVYGYWIGTVPPAVYGLFLAALFAAPFMDPPQKAISNRIRIGLLLIFLLVTAATIVFFFLVRGDSSPETIAGIQGRYFLPFIPLLILPFTGLLKFSNRTMKAAKILLVSLTLICLAVFSYGIYATYYSSCGETLYTGAACTQPVYMNIDKENSTPVEVNQNQTIRQKFSTVCTPISAAQVYIQGLPTNSDGILNIKLVQYPGDLAVAQIDIPFYQIKEKSYLGVPINPAVDTSLKDYEIQLASNALPGDGLLISFNNKNLFPKDEMSINGKLTKGSILYHYTCPNPNR